MWSSIRRQIVRHHNSTPTITSGLWTPRCLGGLDQSAQVRPMAPKKMK
jgi:hypothetical protein